MLLRELRNARLSGWRLKPDTEKSSELDSDKLTRLSIGPAYLEQPSTKCRVRRRRSNGPSTHQVPEERTSTKRKKKVDLSLAQVVPVQKFPAALLNDELISFASPFDDPPEPSCTKSSRSPHTGSRKNHPLSGPLSPETDRSFGYPRFSPPRPNDHLLPIEQSAACGDRMCQSAIFFPPSCPKTTGSDFDMEMLRTLRIDRQRGTTLLEMKNSHFN